jgi:hypothetical protein
MRKTAIVIATLTLGVVPGHAQTYPLSGKWAYDGSAGSGPTACANHATVEFSGDRRFETGGKAPPDYKNVSVEQESKDSYRIVDRFFNGMQDGKVAYTLRRVDPDHIQITHEAGGQSFTLRACN